MKALTSYRTVSVKRPGLFFFPKLNLYLACRTMRYMHDYDQDFVNY